MSCGIGGDASSIWSRTMARIVDSAKPWARGTAKEASRFGPTFPSVPASASTWHEPQDCLSLPGPLMKSCLPALLSAAAGESPPVPQPAAASAVRQTRPAAAKRMRSGGRPARGPELRDGLLARGVDREHAVESRDLEDLRDVAVAADERELAVVRAEPLDAADEHAERRRVDERRPREVDDHLARPLPDHLEQLLLELGRGVE